MHPIQNADEAPEMLELVERESMVPSVLAHHHVRDRTLAPHGAILPIKPDGIERTEVEFVPGARLKVLVPALIFSR